MNREKVNNITFIDPPKMIDGDLELILNNKVPADHVAGFLPIYKFTMINKASGAEMGGINLRVGHTENVKLYKGNIGFTVNENYRGKRYAARSCLLLTPLIRYHKLKPVWITCDVDNAASKRTIELIGADFIDTVSMPDDFPYIEYYPECSRVKHRYRWDVQID